MSLINGQSINFLKMREIRIFFKLKFKFSFIWINHYNNRFVKYWKLLFHETV